MSVRDIAIACLLVVNMFIGYFAYSNYISDAAGNETVERMASQIGTIVGRAQACDVADPNAERFIRQVMRQKAATLPDVQPMTLERQFTKAATINNANFDVGCDKVRRQYAQALEIIARQTNYTYTGVKRLVRRPPQQG